MRFQPKHSAVLFVGVGISLFGTLCGQTLVFHLSGDQEVPPVSTSVRGGCMGVLNQPAGSLNLTCVHNADLATIVHIHRGASGVNGPVVFDLGAPTSPISVTWSGMTPADVADLFAGNLYLNIHTVGRPDGEARGQILPRTVDVVTFSASGGQVFPPSPSAATASCTADLNAAATDLAINCTHNMASPSSAHLHESPSFQTGPIVFTFASASSPISENVPLTPLLVADFAAGFLYLDIHGAGGEEIRGQIGAVPVIPSIGSSIPMLSDLGLILLILTLISAAAIRLR